MKSLEPWMNKIQNTLEVGSDTKFITDSCTFIPQAIYLIRMYRKALEELNIQYEAYRPDTMPRLPDVIINEALIIDPTKYSEET